MPVKYTESLDPLKLLLLHCMSSTSLSVCLCEVWMCVCVWEREREWILCYIQSQIFYVFWLYVLPDLISPNRNWTRATAVKTLSLNHWTTKEFPRIIASPPVTSRWQFLYSSLLRSMPHSYITLHSQLWINRLCIPNTEHLPWHMTLTNLK